MLKSIGFSILNMNRGDRIKSAIEGSGVKQGVIAKFCGVSPGSITQWKTGETKDIRMNAFLKLCEITKHSPWWIALGEGERQLPNQQDDDPFIKEMKSLSSTERLMVLELIGKFRESLADATELGANADKGEKWTKGGQIKGLARISMIEKGNKSLE